MRPAGTQGVTTLDVVRAGPGTIVGRGEQVAVPQGELTGLVAVAAGSDPFDSALGLGRPDPAHLSADADFAEKGPSASGAGRALSLSAAHAASDEGMEEVRGSRADSVIVEFVGQWGGTTLAVAVSGNLALIGSGPRVLVLDVSDPANPTLLGQSEVLPGIAYDIAIAGEYAYVANEYAGLQVIDISNPAAPFRAGGYDTSRAALDVAKAVGLLLTAPRVAGQAYNCYDMYISEETVARIARELTGSRSEISDLNRGPQHRIETGKLRALGMEFGGEPLLRATIRAMLEASSASG